MALSWRPAALMMFGIIPAIIAQAPLVVLLWALFVVLVCVFDIVRAARPRSLQISRSVPVQVRLSQTVEAELIIRNPTTKQARGVIRDGWQPSAGAEETEHAISIAPGSAARIKVRLTPSRRGNRHAEYVAARLFGPLGFAARQYTFAGPATLRVLPEFKSRRHLPSRLALLRELDGESSVQMRAEGTEFDSLRAYVEGDDVRSIDWRATARAREVTVRTWRPERDRRVFIVLDTSRTSAPRVRDEPRLDTFIESALLLGALSAKAGDKVEFIAFDREIRARTTAHSATTVIKDLGIAMADLEPALVEADWDTLSATIRSRTKQRSLIVFLTNASLAQADVGIIGAIGSLARSNPVVVASVADPEVAEISKLRDRATETYDAAAAEKSMLDEQAGAAVLAQFGVTVLHGSPEQLPPRLADKYIELKAAGLL